MSDRSEHLVKSVILAEQVAFARGARPKNQHLISEEMLTHLVRLTVNEVLGTIGGVAKKPDVNIGRADDLKLVLDCIADKYGITEQADGGRA